MKKLFYAVIKLVLVIGLSIYFGCAGVYFGCAGMKTKVLKIVMIPGEDAELELARMRPIAEYLGKKIGIPVEVVVTTDYSTAIVSLKIGDAQIARLGPFSYVLATTQMKCEPLVREVQKKSKSDRYHGVIITKGGSGIKTLEDLKGKTFAFVDVASASGYLVPKAFLINSGISPEKDFKKIFFAGSHDAVWLAVKNGMVDAGATNDWRITQALEAGVLKPGEISIVATTDAIPHSPITVRSDMDKELRKKLLDAWLTIPGEFTEPCGILGYVEAVDSDYDFLRKTAKTLNLDLTKQK